MFADKTNPLSKTKDIQFYSKVVEGIVKQNQLYEIAIRPKETGMMRIWNTWYWLKSRERRQPLQDSSFIRSKVQQAIQERRLGLKKKRMF